MTALRALLAAELRILARDKTSLTFTFFFPLLFILIFGAMMGGMGSAEGSRLGLVVQGGGGERLRDVIAEVRGLRTTEYTTSPALEADVAAGDVDFGLMWDGTILTTVVDVRRAQENSAYKELARGIASRFELAVQGREPLVAVEQVVEGGGGNADWLTRVVPGIVAFSVLSAGLFAVAGHITSMKRRRLLDRFIVTPMRPASLVAAVVASRLVVVFASTLITLWVAILVFRVELHVDWLRYVVSVAAATIGSMGMGTLIALVVRQPSSAANLANVLSMVMMFVSGIYFPVEIMPGFLRAISAATPLQYMADAMRYATGVVDMSPARFWAINAALLGLGVVLLPVLSRYLVRAERR
ncbi:MAG: ABC transporter permease [Candidatus Bipolaricaulota bacterium]|nr:ABC transporter permease [Candidatus Bipolaricaulota bacterium]